MGATVSVGRRVAALRTSDEKVVYVLFENTYEKNCHPHTPHWCCIGIGYAKDAMKRIFDYGSGCEGGMLQNRSGHMLPEGYIRSFLKEMSAPYPIRNRQITLKLEDRLYATIAKEDFAKIETALVSIGRADVAERLRRGETVEISLHGDIDIVLAVYGIAGKVTPPWRLGLYEPPDHEAKLPALGDEKDWVSVHPAVEELPIFHRLGADERLQQLSDRRLVAAGWPYSIVGKFIRQMGESGEIHKYADRIKSFRNLVEFAPAINPDALKVVFDEAAPLEVWGRRVVDEFKAKYPVVQTGSGFEFALSSESYGDALRLQNAHFEFVSKPQAAAA